MPAGDMDPQYSIGVNNRFNGIDSDIIDDPLELIRAAQEKPKKEKEKERTKKDTKAPLKGFKDRSAKTEPTLSSPTEGKQSENSDRPRGRGRGGSRGRGGDRGRGRGGRGGGFGGGFGSSNDDSQSQPKPRGPPRGGACHRCGEEGHFVRECSQPKSPDVQQSGGFGDPSTGGETGFSSGGFGAPSGGFGSNDNNEERRGGRGGFRGGRGGRGGRGRGRGGGREFDRRSGSDKSSVKAFDKRDGSGSYNWGTATDELAASEEQPQGGFGGFGTPPQETEETPTEDSTQEATDERSAEDEEQNKENKEAEVSEMTFEDYKKKQEESRAKPQYNIRKANEGEKLKGLKELKKPTEKESEADGSLFFPQRTYEERLKTSGRVKDVLEVKWQYSSGDNRHMDSGRKGGKGRGGRNIRGGGRRDDSDGGKAPQLENAEEFPSL